MKIGTTTVSLGGLVLIAVVALWWSGRPSTSDRPTPLNQQTSFFPAIAASPKEKREVKSPSPVTMPKMSDLEWDHFKVHLPEPIYEPWKAAVLNSENCLDSDNKQTALRVLPNWIRQATLAGRPDEAARYLGTLFKLSEDADPKVAAEDVIGIYRLGDYNGTASTQMRKWIESGGELSYIDPSTGSTKFRDIRAQVIEELESNNDRSLDHFLYEIWAQNRGSESRQLGKVDYAYLEEHGGSM